MSQLMLERSSCDVILVSWSCPSKDSWEPRALPAELLSLHSESVYYLKAYQPVFSPHFLVCVSPLIEILAHLLSKSHEPLADLEFPIALPSWIWCDFWLRVAKYLHRGERRYKGAKKQTDTAAFTINHNLSNMSQVQILTYKYINL